MSHLVYTFFIALSNNLDNIGARVAYSMRGIRISTPVNLWISVITFIISALAAYSGTAVSGILSKEATSIIAMLILTAVGSWMILEQYMKKNDDNSKDVHSEQCSGKRPGIIQILSNPEIADIDGSKHIDFKEATLLGIALSINNVGGGLSAGMIGLNSILVGLLSAVINFIALWAGNYIAAFFTRWNLDKKATIVAGIVLIAIGIEQIV